MHALCVSPVTVERSIPKLVAVLVHHLLAKPQALASNYRCLELLLHGLGVCLESRLSSLPDP